MKYVTWRYSKRRVVPLILKDLSALVHHIVIQNKVLESLIHTVLTVLSFKRWWRRRSLKIDQLLVFSLKYVVWTSNITRCNIDQRDSYSCWSYCIWWISCKLIGSIPLFWLIWRHDRSRIVLREVLSQHLNSIISRRIIWWRTK